MNERRSTAVECSGFPVRARYLGGLVTLIFLSILANAVPSLAQTKRSGCDQRLGLLKMTYVGFTKYRWQVAEDAEGDKDPDRVREVQRVMGFGTKAIPMLIECLTDRRNTKQPLWDYWGQTPVNVVAFSILRDLFTDQMGRTTFEGTPTWDDLQSEAGEGAPAWEAWETYNMKHGPKYMQLVWRKAWTEKKDLVYWDGSDLCFKLKGTQ